MSTSAAVAAAAAQFHFPDVHSANDIEAEFIPKGLILTVGHQSTAVALPIGFSETDIRLVFDKATRQLSVRCCSFDGDDTGIQIFLRGSCSPDLLQRPRPDLEVSLALASLSNMWILFTSASLISGCM